MQIKFRSNQTLEIEAKLGIDYDRLKPFCPRYHIMKRKRGNTTYHGPARCTKCGEKELTWLYIVGQCGGREEGLALHSRAMQ